MTKKSWSIVLPKDFESTDKEYYLNDKSYSRVTTILNIIAKPGVRNWMAKVGRKKVEAITKRRCDLGTTVHHLFELTLKGKSFNLGNYEAEIREDLDLFDEFRINTCIEPEALEQRLWNNEYGYAGTADYIGRYKSFLKYMVRGHKTKFTKESRVLGDWKTSADIYPQYWLQMAAYVAAFEELTGIKLDGAFIAQFRYGKIRVKEMTYDELMIEFEGYLHALGLYDWQHKKGIWSNVKR
jgi:hypothetical protein